MRIWKALFIFLLLGGLIFSQKLHEGKLLRQIDELKMAGTNIIAHSYKPLLTISNRPYLRFENTVVLHVSDSEWRLLTNAYPARLETNVITFTTP